MIDTLLNKPFKILSKNSFLYAVWMLLFLLSQNSFAQQIFPVTINGNLIPPHSLSLQDYGFEKSDDIMYMMTLIDALEETRAVKYRLTIKNNGTPIIETNPNYNPAPVILERQIPLMINGVDLAGYFDPLNLVRVDGGGPGGSLLPAGFISICLEVIDVERGVPISDQFCANGIFELSQPPLLNLPLCFSEMPLEDTENMMFSWTAMHQLSFNQPMGVEYEFTLIKLLPGIADPNDGFNFGIPILQTTQSQTVLYYLQDNPPLEVGAVYAWRVQAKDILGTDVFLNGGYSNVCTFKVTDPTAPPGGGPGLFSCGDGACDYNGTISNTPFTGNISSGDKVAVGNFEMTVEQISNNGGVYSGTGTIYIPFIYSKLKVTFDDISINGDQRVSNGLINSAVDDNSLIPPLFSLDNMSSMNVASASTNFATEVLTGFSNSTAAALETHFDGSDNTHMVSFLEDVVEGAAIPIGLPIGIDKTIEETNSKFTIAISAIVFSPTDAKMNAILITKFEEGGEYVKFGGRGICFQPQGIAATNPKLELLSDVALESLGAPITLVGMENGDSRTYLSFDCNGFEEFSLTGRYLFDETLIKTVDAAQPQVIATMNATTRSLTDFMASVDPIDDFQFVGAEEFTFKIGEATFDFSPTQNPTDIIFPEDFPTDRTNETFKGFFLSNASVELPAIFSTTTSGTLPQLIGTSILFTNDGFTGSLLAENLINLETGDIGGWSYSMDSAYLNILNNDFIESGFIGKMKLPIMDDTEYLKYKGVFAMGGNGLDINFDVLPEVITIDLLRASFNFDLDSKISIGRLNGKFQMPTVNLSGILSSAIPEGDPGFVGDIMSEINNLKDLLASAGLGDFIPKLDMEGIRFEGFKIDMNAPDKFTIGSITPQGLDLNFLGIDCDISSINFKKLSLPDLEDMNVNIAPGTISRALNFNMDFAKDLLGIAAPNISFNLIINEIPTIDGGGGGGLSIPKFKFGGFDLSFGAGDFPSFSCGENLDEITPADFQALATEAIPIGTGLKIGHFNLAPDYGSLSDDGAGTISGEGIVDVPILGPLSKLKVAFTNVKVDQGGRIIEGEVVAAGVTPPDLGGLLGKIDAVKDGIAAGVNALNGLELPLIMGLTADGENERDQGLILMGLVFSPTEAKTQGKIVFEISDGKYAEFKAEGLTIVPDGIANFDLAVGLAADLEFTPIDGVNPLVFKAYDNVNKTGSFVKCDCNGFQEFRLGGEYEFSKDQIVSLDDPDVPVKASFNFGTKKWGEFIGKMESMGNFTIPGLEGFDFVVSDAYLDFSKEENVFGIDFPEGYTQVEDPNFPNIWKGFYIKEIGLTLPEAFVLTEGGARPQFTGQNLLIDPSGVSTTLIGADIMDGEVEGWVFKMDSIGVNIIQSGLVESGIKGIVGIPIIDDVLPYQGALVKDDLGFYKMSLFPQTETRLNISALRSYIDVGGETQIVLQSVPHPTLPNKTTFKPYADLYGGVGVDVSMEDFNNFIGPDMVSVKEFIETTLDIGALGFTPPAISFEGFKINHPVLPDTSDYRIDNYDIQGGIAIGDYELGLSALQMVESPSMKFDLNGQEVNLPGVGLNFSMSIPLIKIDLEFWAKEQTVVVGGKSKKKFSFGKINLETSIPTFACDGDCPEPPTDQTVAASPVVGESFQSGDFEIEVTEANKGTVKVGFLNAELNVAFSDVQLNAAGELISGTVITDKDAGLFSGDLISVGVEGEQIQLPLMDDLTNAMNDFAKLPFSLNEFIKTSTGLQDDLPFDFIVVGMRFTPEGAKLDGLVLFGTPDGTQLKFGATGLCMTNEGVNLDQIKLFIAEEITLNDWEMPITILPGNSTGDDGSYATFSCSGLEQFHLQARYDFPDDQLTPVDETLENVAAYFTIKSATLGQFIATATMDPFMIAGVDDVVFEIRNANIDYSETQNPDNFPDTYFTDLPNPIVPSTPNAATAANGNNLWRGFFLELVSVGLPGSFAKEGGERITLEGTNFIYDKGNGMSATLAANNLLKLKGEDGAGETGDLNGWAFSIDQLAIDIKFNSLEKFSLDGKIHIPVTKQGDEIAYQAAIGMDDNNKPTAQFTLGGISKEYGIPFLGETTKMTISEGSVVGIKYEAGDFQPYADVSGAFTFELEKPEFKIELLSFENFKINDFNMPAPPKVPNVKTGGLKRISFKGFKFAGIDLPTEIPIGDVTPDEPPATENNNEKMGGFPINISNIKFTSVTEGGEDLKKLTFGLGVNFTGKGGGAIAGYGGLAILGKLNLGKLTSEPWKAVEFKSVDVASILIEGDMGDVAMTGGLHYVKDDPIYGESFKGLFDMRIGKSLRVEAVGQFGTTAYDHRNTTATEDFRYFFVDGKGTFFPGVGAFGVAVYGFGGGFFYNMTKGDLTVPSFVVNETGSFKAASNTQAPPMQAPPTLVFGDPRLEPGISLSGAKYFPAQGNLAVKATVIAGLQNPQVLNAEATLGIDFNTQGGVNKIFFEGKAFALCESILEKENASIKGSLDLEVDFNNNWIIGNSSFLVKTEVVEGNGKGNFKFPFGSFDDPLKEKWHLHMGTPSNPIKISFKIPGIKAALPGVESYFMAGHDLPEPTSLTSIHSSLAEFDGKSNNKSSSFSGGTGVAFGARLTIPKKKFKVAIFTASIEAGAGFDVSMAKYKDVFCGANGSLVGLQGWYLKGRAYAYLQGSVDMYVDVFIFEGNINLMKLTVSAALQAQLPNPTWMSAQIRAKGSVLNGLIEVSKSIKVEIGEKCAGLGDVNPLADISIITDFQPNDSQNETNIPVYFEPKVAFSRYVSKNPNSFSPEGYLQVVTIDDDGNDQQRFFAPYLRTFEIRKSSKTGTLVSTKSKKFTDYNKAITLTAENIFDPNAWYYTKVEIGWKEYNEDLGTWNVSYYKGKPIIEKREAKFKTGGLPDRIVKEMLSYHAPGDRQRNWHKNYADPMLEFKQAGYGYLFDKCQDVKVGTRKVTRRNFFGFKYTNTVNVNQKVCYDYVYQLTNLNTGEVANYPLSHYPQRNARFERTELSWKSLMSGIFPIPVYKKKSSQGTKIQFSTLNNSGRLAKNAVYKLEIMGIPQKSTATSAIASSVTKTLSTNSNFNVVKVESKLKAAKKDPTKENRMLYEYHFKTSKYNSLRDKLAAMKYVRKSNGVKRTDIGHPKMEKSYSLPYKNTQHDDYYLHSSDEGFDKFDQERLRNNTYFNHLYYANRHPFETPTYYARHPLFKLSYWDLAKSNLKTSGVHKNIAIAGKSLTHSWQLEQISNYVLRPYWYDDDYGMRIQFPSSGKQTLSDWDVRNPSRAIQNSGVACYYCNTKGYSTTTNWSLSLTVARRRIMTNQYSYLQFMGSTTWKYKKGLFGEPWRSIGAEAPFAHYMFDLDNPPITIGRTLTWKYPYSIYYGLWGKNYMKSSSAYYRLYTNGGLNHSRYRVPLDGMKFIISYSKPDSGWKTMQEKAARIGNEDYKFWLKDRLW